MVTLALVAIVPQLPPELLPRISPTTVNEAFVRLPRERIAAQLTSGAVRVSFGELRNNATPGAIVSGADQDGVQVTLPLGEVIARLGNLAFNRRSGQGQVTVPPDIVGPFGKECKGLRIAKESASENAPASAPRTTPASSWTPPRTAPAAAPVRNPASQPAPASRPASTAAVRPPSTASSPALTAATPTASAKTPSIAANSAPKPISVRLNSAAAPAAPIARRPVNAPVGMPAQSKAVGQAVPPQSRPLPKAAVRPTPGTSAGPFQRAPSAQPSPAASAPSIPKLRMAEASSSGVTTVPAAPVSEAPPTPAAPSIAVPVAVVMERWIEAVKQEIAALNVQQASIEIPGDALELALKSGKVAFTWKLIRSWLNPTPVDALPSVNDGTVLDLPLSVVAPIFLKQRQSANRRRQVAVDTSIPDLFSGKDRELSSNNLVTAPTREQTSNDQASAAPAVAAQPALKPNDLIRNAAALGGVDGCLISLHDGLLVAGQVPPPWSSDTLAAFVPQIFGRVNQTMRELRLGDLNNLSFTVGNVPWLIVRQERTYFAAFGRAGSALPMSELMTLAAELERKG